METHPREWRRCPIGRVSGCGVCSCVVVVAMKVWVSQRTEAAAERMREGLIKDKKRKRSSMSRKRLDKNKAQGLKVLQSD